MRLLSLDLERYGPFTGYSLAFRPDARLHVVFGPNEAGKSSSLAAVTDLLFGVKRQTPDDFLRPGKEMRLAAEIADAQGNRLAFRRRKLKPLLTDADDAALPDDALAPFLGGMTREVFQRAFGLDAEALRRCGEELKASDGELGAALFSAASGLRGLNALQSALEREADAIFAERRSQNRTLYQALDRFEAARKLLREHETRSGALKTMHDQLAQHRRHNDEIAARRRQIALDIARIERLRRAAPILHEIDAEAARHAALEALPDAPEGTGTQLLQALEETARTAEGLASVTREEERLRQDCAAIIVDEPLLAAAGEIERLQVRLGQFEKGMADLPAIERDAASASRDLGLMAGRLGLADMATLPGLMPDDAALAHLAELLAQGRALLLARDARNQSAAREQEALEARRRERGARGPLRDPRPLRERLAALSDLARFEQKARDGTAAIAAETAMLAQAAARLMPPVADLAALAGRSLPASGTIAGFARHASESETALARERQAIAELHSDIARLDERQETLAAGSSLPTAERLAAARALREGHWAALRAMLFGTTPLEPAALAAAVTGFETARSQADTLADAGLADAQRVAAHAELGRTLARRQAELTARGTSLAGLEQAQHERGRAWAGLWQASGIAPLGPAEMLAWQDRLERLLDRNERLAETAEQVAMAQGRLAEARPAIGTLLRELGLTDHPGLAIETTLRRAEAEIDRLAEGWDAARDSDTLVADLEQRAAQALTHAEAAEREHAAWLGRFQAALNRIGLPTTASPAEAEASLSAWREVPGLSGTFEDLKRRIAGIRRDAADFRDDLRALAQKVAPDLVGEPQAVLPGLAQRLNRMREAATRREEMDKRLAATLDMAGHAAGKHDRAAGIVAALAARLDLPTGSDGQALGTQLALRDELRARLRQKRAELARVADGRDEETLRADLAGHDLALADAERAVLEEETRRIEDEGREAYAAAKALELRIEDLGGSVTAEVALQQRRGAESELQDAAREWAVLSAGALLVGAAVARQRRSRQEPLMLRAGACFSQLTGGLFAGLGQAFDASDIPHLVGRRRDGGEVEVSQMSEGTRDQLYLALRLASVEEHAARTETPPFLADDLFSSFDDARTACGLHALAALAPAVQPILFTHHRFVVDSARRELGAAADIIELG